MQNPINQNSNKLKRQNKQSENELNSKMYHIENILLKDVDFVYSNQKTTSHYNVKSQMQVSVINGLDPMPTPLKDDSDRKYDETAYASKNWSEFWKHQTIVRVPLKSKIYPILDTLYSESESNLYDEQNKRNLFYFEDNKFGYFCVPNNVLESKYNLFSDFVYNSFIDNITFRTKLLKKFNTKKLSKSALKSLVYDFKKRLLSLLNLTVLNNYKSSEDSKFDNRDVDYSADDLMYKLEQLLDSNLGKNMISNHVIHSFKFGLKLLSFHHFKVQPLTKNIVHEIGDLLDTTNVNKTDHFVVSITGEELGEITTHHAPVDYVMIEYLIQKYINKVGEYCHENYE